VKGRVFLLAALTFAACTKGRLVNPPPVTFAQRDVRVVENAIVKGMENRGWLAQKAQPGVIFGTLNIRSHQAVVRADYDATSYQIRYVSSVDLDYEKNADGSESIHENYNGWIQNLRNDIDTLLAGPPVATH
jgi:hypothetical protein